MDSRTITFVILPLGVFLLAIGGAGLLLLAKALKRRLKLALGDRELPPEWSKHSSLIVPWREVLLGVLIVFAVPIFTKFCLTGNASDAVSAIVGYISAGLCALGCFTRQKRDLDEIGLANDLSGFIKILIAFACSLVLFLCGQMTMLLAIYSQVVLSFVDRQG